MSDTVALVPASTINYGPVQLDRQKLALIGNTIAPDLTPNELALFGEVCMRKQLDPFSGQIHAIKRFVNQKVNGQWQKVPRVTFQTSQEGFLSLAERTNEYDGMDPPVYGPLCGCGLVKARSSWDDDTNERGEETLVLHPEYATVTVYRRGFTRPISATAYWHEYYPGQKQGGMWHKMPRIMLAKVARVAALRLAFPYVMGGLLSDDEMQQADREPRDVTPALVPGEPVGNAVSAPVQAPPAPPVEEPSGQAAEERSGEAVATPPQAPANAMPVMPLAGANVSRRLGPGRSISPVRRNVTTVQPPTATVTDTEAPPAAPSPEVTIPSQPAPSALTDEPDLPVAPEPEDPGKAQFLNDLRGDLRVQTAALFRVNALLENVKAGLEGKKSVEVPPSTPSEASDKALTQRIDADYPGRRLENLGERELSALLERFQANLARKREVLKERGISEE